MVLYPADQLKLPDSFLKNKWVDRFKSQALLHVLLPFQSEDLSQLTYFRRCREYYQRFCYCAATAGI